jgi:hypothetical protein
VNPTGQATPNPTTKDELLKTLRNERAELEAMIDALPSQKMTQPGVIEDWSVKDLIAHFMLWEGWILDKCQQLLLTGTVTLDERDTRPTDEMNALHYEANLERSVDDIRYQERAIFEEILGVVEAFDEQQLFEPNHYSFPRGFALADEIKNETYRHYRAHSDDLKRGIVNLT